MKKVSSILFALVLVFSFAIVAVPMAGTVEGDPGDQYWYWTNDYTPWRFIMYKGSGDGTADHLNTFGYRTFSDEVQVAPGADYSGTWTGSIRVRGTSTGGVIIVYIGVGSGAGTFTSKGSQFIWGVTTSYADYALSVITTGLTINAGEYLAVYIGSTMKYDLDLTGSNSPCWIKSPSGAPDYPVSGPPNNPPNAPTNPLCEGQTNPTDITTLTPTFSWTFSDPDGGDTQGAWQIHVSTEADGGGTMMWDSGKQSGGDASDVYEGSALDWGAGYHWWVKTWDNHDAEGPYCADQTFTTKTAPEEVWVDDDWTCQDDVNAFDPSLAWQIDAFAVIQDGVNAVATGGTVNVRDGTYNENVNVNRGLILKASSKPIIDGDATGDGVPDEDCIKIQASSVTIDGFELWNGYNGIRAFDISNSVIKNNTIHDNLNIPGYAGCGILLWGDNDDNQILNNEIYDNDRQGVFIGSDSVTKISTGNTISGNTIYDNGLYRQPNGPDASMYGIQLWNADNNTVEDNEIYGHDDWFPYPDYPDYDFAQGIYLCDANDNTIMGNHLHENNYGVGQWHSARPAANNDINFNNITGNTGFGVKNYDAFTIDATNNSWGHASGPSGEYGRVNSAGKVIGKGDAVSDNVDWDPWLPQPINLTKHIPVPPGLLR